MHTFEISCHILNGTCDYLRDNLPSLVRVSQYVERTNFYAGKGLLQIELREFPYVKYGVSMSTHYLVIRCNLSAIMGESKLLLLNMEEYSAEQILERLQHRLYEVDAFRYVRLDKMPVTIFRANRVDLAIDLTVKRPDAIAWLANMSFPYHHRNMARKPIPKSRDISDFESCYFGSKSRTINAYVKWAEIVNNGRVVPPEEEVILKNIFRIEVQISKKGIYNLRLPTGREIRPFLDESFCREYLLKEIKALFGITPYLSKSKVIEAIEASQNSVYNKAVMVSIVNMIERYGGLYEVEKAIEEEHAPTQYGNSLRAFRQRWLKRFQQLGIQPVAIPDSFGIDEVPSIYELLKGVDTL